MNRRLNCFNGQRYVSALLRRWDYPRTRSCRMCETISDQRYIDTAETLKRALFASATLCHFQSLLPLVAALTIANSGACLRRCKTYSDSPPFC